MRVTDVETFVADADWWNWFFVRVTTDEGITGVGEALSGEGLTAALEATAEAHKHYVIGEDPLNRKAISRKLRRYPFAWRAGKLIDAVAAAVDIALSDIGGRYYGEPSGSSSVARSATRSRSTRTAGTSASARPRTTPATRRRPSRSRGIRR